MKYMQLKRLIVPSQHGFVPNKACVTNQLETLDFITDALKSGHSVDLVYISKMDRVVFDWQKTESNRGTRLRMGGCDPFGSARFGAWTPPIYHFYK